MRPWRGSTRGASETLLDALSQVRVRVAPVLAATANSTAAFTCLLRTPEAPILAAPDPGPTARSPSADTPPSRFSLFEHLQPDASVYDPVPRASPPSAQAVPLRSRRSLDRPPGLASEGHYFSPSTSELDRPAWAIALALSASIFALGRCSTGMPVTGAKTYLQSNRRIRSGAIRPALFRRSAHERDLIGTHVRYHALPESVNTEVSQCAESRARSG